MKQSDIRTNVVTATLVADHKYNGYWWWSALRNLRSRSSVGRWTTHFPRGWRVSVHRSRSTVQTAQSVNGCLRKDKKIWISLWTILSTKINWMNSDHERLRLRRGILLSSITVDEIYLWRKHWKLRWPLIATWRYFWLKISQSERSVLKTLAYLKKYVQCSTGWPKNWHTLLYALTTYALTSSNIDRFSNSFHCQNQETIFNITIKIPPHQVCRYTTVWNVSV